MLITLINAIRLKFGWYTQMNLWGSTYIKI